MSTKVPSSRLISLLIDRTISIDEERKPGKKLKAEKSDSRIDYTSRSPATERSPPKGVRKKK